MTRKEYPLAHYLIATEGLALMRCWYLDDRGHAERLLREVSHICASLDQHPYSTPLVVEEKPPRDGYTEWAPSYNVDNEHNPVLPLEESALDTLLEPTSSGRALDAACGTGRQTARLQRLGYDVTAVDVTAEMLNVARQNFPDVSFHQGELTDLPVDDEEFDLVLCTLAVTHVANLEAVIREFDRVLRPGGRIVIADVHPLQVLLGAHATVPGAGQKMSIVRNNMHLLSRYLNAFLSLGLRVVHCLEPVFTAETAAALPAGPHIPEANTAAFVGTPALLVWAVEKATSETGGKR